MKRVYRAVDMFSRYFSYFDIQIDYVTNMTDELMK
jgi:cysteinyl-tRNA synthetase